MIRRSTVQAIGGSEKEGPDYLYYNADIINNTTDDQASGSAVQDPNIVFNETRDAALIQDASQYHFSIVRFAMNGPNKDLPLFIPTIQTGTGQTNVNLTSYGLAISLQTFWTSAVNGKQYEFNTTPANRFVQYEPETKNPRIAPTPSTLAAATYRGIFNPLAVYEVGDIVGSSISIPYGNGQPPYYQVRTPDRWNSKTQYPIGTFVLWSGKGWTNIAAVPYSPTGSNPSPTQAPAVWVPGVPAGTPVTNSTYWTTCPATLGGQQDLTSRYYWVYTYQHWLDLVNKTILNPSDLSLSSLAITTPQSCMGDLFNQFVADWQGSGIPDPFPFATLQDFINYLGQPPRLEREGNKFVLYGDSDVFGTRLEPFTPGVPAPYGAPPITPTATQDLPPVYRLFFNTNMTGLFTNFENTYWNITTSVAGDGLLNGLGPVAQLWDAAQSYQPGIPVEYTTNGKRAGYYAIVPNTTPGNDPVTNTPVEWSSTTTTATVPLGYVNQILFPNKFYQNVVDYRLAPYSGTPPLGYVPLAQQKPYWRIEQEQPSDDSLWSPVGSIVFTSTLLPVRAEQVGPPVQLGAGNIGNSTATAQSAFQPIITDISIDTSTAGAGAYRSYIYYAPQAEYRLSDFGASKQPLRNIDVQVFWKCRLNSELYPIQMFNLSTVSFKMMFKKKGVAVGKGERTEIGF